MGAFWLVCSTIAFSVMVLCVRKLTLAGVDPWWTVFIRSAGNTAMLLPILWQLTPQQRQVQQWRALILRGIFGSAALTLYFHAVEYAPASDVILTNYSYPIFSAFVAHHWLKERVGPSIIFALVLLVVGLAVQFAGFRGEPIGYVLGISSAVCAGVAVTAVRKARRTEHTIVVVLAYTIASTLVSAPGAFMTPLQDLSSLWPLLVALAVFASIGQLTMTIAYRTVPTATAGIISMLTFVFTAGAEAFMVDGPAPKETLIGAALIFGGVAIALRQQRKSSVTTNTDDLLPASEVSVRVKA